jgi:radical SAM superfamily enzyme YgiQ (UPF0313 family)
MLYEHNAMVKDTRKVNLRFASCYPDLYRSAMSSLGFHIIYDFLNSREDVYCERVVYPSSKSIETGTGLKDFDMVSFSLQYEQDYFNVLNMLKNGGIPLRKDNRNSKHPLIIAGGPCASSNPLPMSSFIDLFVVGEAEVILDDLVDKCLEHEDPRNNLEDFMEIKGVYPPDNPVQMVTVSDLKDACHPIRQVVPVTDDKEYIPAFGRAFLLEVSRGCTRGCRFCMAGCIYRPRREMPIKDLFKIAERGMHATGLKKVALIGAAVSDHSKMEELCQGLHERGFQVTTPSLRIESVTDNLLEILKQSGLKTITIAPESIWKVRRAANKSITDEMIEDTINTAFNHELNVKLYFMLGLPTEDNKDLKSLGSYINGLIKMGERKNQVRLSINPFIPKPHTPFQWEGFDVEVLKSKIHYMNSIIKLRSFKVESPKTALVQYVLSMGGVELGDVLERSIHEKVSVKEWKNLSHRWDLHEELPWKNIDVGVDDEYLKKEYEKALNGDLTPWCEEFGCYNCGTCD